MQFPKWPVRFGRRCCTSWFYAFDGGKSPEGPSKTQTFVGEVSNLERQVELARNKAAAAKKQEEDCEVKVRGAFI